MITKSEFMVRYEKACNFHRPVDEAAIERHLLKWMSNVSKHPVKVVMLRSAQALRENGKIARDARDARAARDAWDAWDAWAARDARAAWAAWDAWAARAAWDARAAWAARDAWAAWAAAWDVSWNAAVIAAAITAGNAVLYEKWFPFFEAFESGAWMIWVTKDTVCVATLPQMRTIPPNRLHCVDGPAFVWNDVKIYYLNGVLMEPWMVETPHGDLEGAKIIAVKNVDQRRELIRRIGIERVLEHLPHRRLSKRGDYELLSVDLSNDHKSCRYLKMKNPSIGTWHLEGVSNDCSTVQHALNWRAYSDITREWSPAQLS